MWGKCMIRGLAFQEQKEYLHGTPMGKFTVLGKAKHRPCMYKGRRLSDTDISPKPSTASEITAPCVDPHAPGQVSQPPEYPFSPPRLFLGKEVGLGGAEPRNIKVGQPVEPITHPQSRTERHGAEVKCGHGVPSYIFPFYEAFDVFKCGPSGFGPTVFLFLIDFKRQDLVLKLLKMIHNDLLEGKRA